MIRYRPTITAPGGKPPLCDEGVKAGAALEAPGIDRVSTVGVLEIEIALPQEAQKRAPSETITPHTVQVIIRGIVSYRQGSSYELVRVNWSSDGGHGFHPVLNRGAASESNAQLGSDFNSPGKITGNL